MRRLAFTPDDLPSALDVGSRTSVPPPRPVLPVWEPLPASAGRRFSADDLPYDNDWAAPRRSAASASSPVPGYEPLLPPVSRPSAPPQVTVPYQPARSATSASSSVPSMAMPSGASQSSAPGRAEAPSATAPASADTGQLRRVEPPRPRKRRIAIIVALALAVVLIAAAAVWAVVARPGQAPVAADPATKVVDPLLGTGDLTAIAAGPWQETGVTRTPVCVSQDTRPAAQRTASRMLASGSGSVLQLVYTFPDPSTAKQAYTAQLAAAGTCTSDTALITGASTIGGLADSADAVRVTIQGTKSESHVLLLTQSGSTLNTFDVVGVANLSTAKVVQAAFAVLTRQCSAGTTCPTSATVTDSLPAAGDPAGWLVAADLPQITAGSGKWTALPSHAVSLKGSQCENLDLTKVTGTKDAAERVFVLTGDSKAPKQFGLNHVVWTFSSAKAATALANTLTTNLADCTKNTPTATVVPGSAVKGAGQAVQVSGKTWEITHKLTTGPIMFRVAVVTSGTRVSYLLANPSASFDFTDAQWAAIALRAGQRASQAG